MFKRAFYPDETFFSILPPRVRLRYFRKKKASTLPPTRFYAGNAVWTPPAVCSNTWPQHLIRATSTDSFNIKTADWRSRFNSPSISELLTVTKSWKWNDNGNCVTWRNGNFSRLGKVKWKTFYLCRNVDVQMLLFIMVRFVLNSGLNFDP